MKGDLAMQNQRQLFAQNLRRRRTELHMSQVKLAEKISYTGKACKQMGVGTCAASRGGSALNRKRA